MDYNAEKAEAFRAIEELGIKSDVILCNINRLNVRIVALLDQVDSELKEAEALGKEEKRLFDKYFKGENEE